MVHAEEGLHGHAGVPKAFLFSTDIRLYRQQSLKNKIKNPEITVDLGSELTED